MSNHTELMRACGLILALVVHSCSSRFGRVEPHNAIVQDYDKTSIAAEGFRCGATPPNLLELMRNYPMILVQEGSVTLNHSTLDRPIIL